MMIESKDPYYPSMIISQYVTQLKRLSLRGIMCHSGIVKIKIYVILK